LAYQALSDMSKAESSLTASINLLPTQIAIYHLGEVAEQRGDRETAARHYTTVAQAGGELGKAAQIKLSRL
jgi:predicted TPR repeat methyltransferase